MNCNCPDWEEGVRGIMSAGVINVLHGGAPYTGAQFRFCPWCGKKLEAEKESDDSASNES